MYSIIEYILVAIIVIAAFLYVIRSLWKESHGSRCVGCDCCEKGKEAQRLFQLVPEKKDND